ncbi:MAG: biotin/lipoyl-binding protein [Clostridiaceae bacterium]|jgi:HlyD family secretion protein|nr:biotin/lipoyl-binding protein [Bacillota bacterium]NLI38970.1 biotin/lipoyl-binding protein [Clostridiaceae bacterium]
MKKRIIIITIIAIIVIVTAVNLFGKDRTNAQLVRITKAEMGDIQSWLSTNALIQSNDVKNYFGTSGLKVKNIHVEVGDAVKKGDIILEYDLFDLETAVKQAEIQYENALLNLADLISQKEQIEEDMADLEAEILRLDGSTDPQDLATLQTLIQKRDAIQTISDEKIKLMNNSVELAKIGLDSARSRLDEVKDGLVSDIDGRITALNAEEGAPLGMTQPAVVIQDLNSLKGVIQLGKYDAAKIQIGQRAILEYSSNVYEGIVSFISPAASTDLTAMNTYLKAEIDIKNPDALLRVNFDVDADILVGEVKNVLKIPVECIKYDKSYNTSVFVVEDGIANLTQVSLGLQSESEVEVLEGLQPGDRVVINPSMNLTDGSPVVVEGAEQ